VRPVNLIPAEERRGQKAPLRTGPMAYVIVGVLALALIGITVLVLTGNKISDRKDEVASLKSQVASARAQEQELSPYMSFAAMQQAREETVSSLAQSRFDWERVLNELAIVLPQDVWLTNVTAKASADAESSSIGSESITGPSLDIQGCSDGHQGVAKFIAALRDVDGVTRVTVMSSDRPDASGSGASSSGSSSATSSSSSGSSGSSVSCSTRNFISTFEVMAAFDGAVPTATPTTGDSAAVPASTATPSGSTDSQDGGATSAVVSGTGSAP
jgi:Tfp pilus assembly protein PilN